MVHTPHHYPRLAPLYRFSLRYQQAEVVSGLGPCLCWHPLKQLLSIINTHRCLLAQPSSLPLTRLHDQLAFSCFYPHLGSTLQLSTLLHLDHSVYLSRAFSGQVQHATTFPCHLPRHCLDQGTGPLYYPFKISMLIWSFFPHPTHRDAPLRAPQYQHTLPSFDSPLPGLGSLPQSGVGKNLSQPWVLLSLRLKDFSSTTETEAFKTQNPKSCFCFYP